MHGCGTALASLFEQHTDCSGTMGNKRIWSSCRGAVWCRSIVLLWRSSYSLGSRYDGAWWQGPCGSAWSRIIPWNACCAQGQWRITHTCSSLAPWPRRCGRRRASVASWWLRRRRSSSLSTAEHSVVKLSGILFLSHFGPFGPIGMRSYSRVVPLPLMLSSTTRRGLRLFGTEVV